MRFKPTRILGLNMKLRCSTNFFRLNQMRPLKFLLLLNLVMMLRK